MDIFSYVYLVPKISSHLSVTLCICSYILSFFVNFLKKDEIKGTYNMRGETRRANKILVPKVGVKTTWET
jgi:hypothetical protein